MIVADAIDALRARPGQPVEARHLDWHPAQRDRVARLACVAAVHRWPERSCELGFEREHGGRRGRRVGPAGEREDRVEIRAVLLAGIAVARLVEQVVVPVGQQNSALRQVHDALAGAARIDAQPTRRTARRWSSPRAFPPRAPDPASCGSPRCAPAPARAAGRRATRSSPRRSCSCRDRRSVAAPIQAGDSASPRPTR